MRRQTTRTPNSAASSGFIRVLIVPTKAFFVGTANVPSTNGEHAIRETRGANGTKRQPG